jgi:CubicO group peptidase (beta-lactamase class C family)
MSEALPRTTVLLRRGIEEGLQPGAQLFVARGGDTVADLALGEARPGVAMTPETLLLWLSSSKPVAAVAIAQLWERGALALDDPIARFVPEFAAHGKERITLRHALTHTGGFRMLQVGWPESTWEETIARICSTRLEPRWVPGEKAGYHLASSWFLLGEVVRRVDGRAFPDYVRAEIFLPLRMDDCWIGMPVERWRAYRDAQRLAAYWETSTSPATPHPWDEELHVVRCSPGGNGWGPMRQLARLYAALLAGGALDDARVLRPQTVDAIAARQRTGMLDHTFRQVMDWGLGVIPNTRPGLAETAAVLRRTSGGSQGDADATTQGLDLPYHYGLHASRRAYGHRGARPPAPYPHPTHGRVVALGDTGTPSDAVHARRFHALLTAIYEDLGVADARG